MSAKHFRWAIALTRRLGQVFGSQMDRVFGLGATATKGLAYSGGERHMGIGNLDVGVVGAGAWGTALADQLAKQGHSVVLWCYEPEVAQDLHHRFENTAYLAGHQVHKSIRPTIDLRECAADKQVVVVAVPSHHVRQMAIRLRDILHKGTVLVSASKGIENDTLMTMSEVYADVLGSELDTRYAVLSGPSFAIEVAREMPTAVTVASWDHRVAVQVQHAVSSTWFRAYTTSDVIGVEMGGALKNVVAIAVGAMDGMGFGHNTRAGLITRGLSEIGRIAVRKGANPLTISGLSGLGDLVLTCTGELSRNRTFGVRLGRGESVGEILTGQRQVVEGFLTARSAHHLARQLGVEAAIIENLYKYLHENESDRPISDFVYAVMSRDLKPEFSFF